MIFDALSRFLFGEVRVRVEAPAHVVASFFVSSGTPVYGARALEDAFECTLEGRQKKAFLSLCASKGWRTVILRERGARTLCARVLRRPGLLFGAILALVSLFESEKYVWQMKISGNETLTADEVSSILREQGLYVGCRHASLDLQSLCDRIPSLCPEISWISVNMMGSVAEVEVSEYIKKEPQVPQDGDGAVNLVSGYSGQIVRFELSRGRPVVSVGQMVEKGDLLVAGYSDKESGPLPRPSSGKVFAKVFVEKSLTLPYEYTAEKRKEPILIQKSANILGKEIFFYKKGLQSWEKYDIVKDEYRPSVFGTALPFTIVKSYLVPVEEITEHRDRDKTGKELRERLLSLLRAESDEILSVTFTESERDGALTVRACAVCVIDVAVRVKILGNET